MSYPVGYIEKRGRCWIKKVYPRGYKYRIFYGRSYKDVATIHQARQFAMEDLRRIQ